jgi:hypothetical protein
MASDIDAGATDVLKGMMLDTGPKQLPQTKAERHKRFYGGQDMKIAIKIDFLMQVAIHQPQAIEPVKVGHGGAGMQMHPQWFRIPVRLLLAEQKLVPIRQRHGDAPRKGGKALLPALF